MGSARWSVASPLSSFGQSAQSIAKWSRNQHGRVHNHIQSVAVYPTLKGHLQYSIHWNSRDPRVAFVLIFNFQTSIKNWQCIFAGCMARDEAISHSIAVSA